MDISDIRSAAPQAQATAVPTAPPSASRQTATTVPDLPGVALEPTTATPNSTPIGKEELNSAVKDVRSFIDTFAAQLDFSVDDDSGRTIVKVIDTETKELIRQIPSQEMLEIAKALDNFKGLFVQQKA
ncbi:MAG: hypothetical protein ACD_45C00364G0001 [uncultured bacterium]|nr:MAG: hypothetical protein ACD_45C00364G0001 [uncultured bacterium]